MVVVVVVVVLVVVVLLPCNRVIPDNFNDLRLLRMCTDHRLYRTYI